MDHFLRKGDRIRASWLQATDASLAGVADKVGAVSVEVVGVVTHVRGDHPTNPTSIRVWVKPDAGGDDVIVDPKHIVAVG